ncbi:TIGR02300 family protein [Acuticoccus sp.]|uniref:TIGR02300 family protein n=1 Tax=Acuticoccus sp. TaxID=1904378 RepID=UPI003B5233D6
MAKPELGTKRLCPNCGAKYYDLHRDPIICPRCNVMFATGVVATRREMARAEEDDDEVDVEDEGVELVALEEADEDEGDAAAADDEEDIAVAADEDVAVVTDDDVLVDDDSDDEVSDVVRGSDEDEEER